jgi:transposase
MNHSRALITIHAYKIIHQVEQRQAFFIRRSLGAVAHAAAPPWREVIKQTPQVAMHTRRRRVQAQKMQVSPRRHVPQLGSS